MTKLITKLSIATFLVVLPTQVFAQSLPSELAKELAKKYTPRKAIVTEYTQNGHKTQKNSAEFSGPFVAKNVFNLANASLLGKPAKRVRKYCEKEQSGTFNQTSLIFPNYSLSQDPVSITDKGQTFSVSADELYVMARTLKPWVGDRPSKIKAGWPRSHTLKYEKLSREEKLGVFNCSDAAGSILWSVAIIPDQYYTTKPSILEGDVLYDKQISILPLDAETITKHKAAQASLEARAVQNEQDTQNKKAQIQASAERFRATADVGSETNCGMIIQSRGRIFEVDLKSSIAKSTGKSTAWVKADDLHPADSPERCWVK